MTKFCFSFEYICKFIPDGKTDGPEALSGPIGRQISGKDGLIRTKLFEDFVPIEGYVEEIPLENQAILQNTDVRLFYHLCRLVQTKDPDLFKYYAQDPGHLHNAR